MGEIVYVDLLFLINFSMDFLCFYLTARILSLKLSVPRTVLAAVVGGIYSDIALFISVGRLLGVLIDILICVLMCVIAFYKKKEARSPLLYTLVYFAVSMALGGFMTAIFNLLNKASMPSYESGGDGISVFSFALLAAVSAVITLIGGRFFKSRSLESVAELEVTVSGKSKRLRGFADSGNLLREPISAKPCVVCDVSALRDILPSRVYRAASTGRYADMVGLDESLRMGIRLVPIKTAGEDGMLIAIKADSLTVISKKKERSVDAYVALGKIKDGTGGFEALIPNELMI